MPGQSVFQRVVGHLVDYALRQVRMTCSTPSGMPCRLGGAAGGPVLPRPGPFPPVGATPVRLTFACDTGSVPHRARLAAPVDPRLCGAGQGLNTTAAGVVAAGDRRSPCARGRGVGPLLAAPGPGSIPAGFLRSIPPVQTGVVRFPTAGQRTPSRVRPRSFRRSAGSREQILDTATEVGGELPCILHRNRPVALAGDIANVGLRQPEGLREVHLRDAGQRHRSCHAIGTRLQAEHRELLLGETRATDARTSQRTLRHFFGVSSCALAARREAQ